MIRPCCSSPARARLLPLIVGFVLAAWAGACASLPGPGMQLSAADRRGGDTGVWWHVAADDGLRSPVVGIEQRLSEEHVRQWLVDDRGVRRFEYHGGHLSGCGPPVSSAVVSGNPWPIASLIRRRFGASDEPGWPGPALPGEEVAKLTNAADLVALLQRRWASAQTDPPDGLSPHEVNLVMDAAEITLADLLASGR